MAKERCKPSFFESQKPSVGPQLSTHKAFVDVALRLQGAIPDQLRAIHSASSSILEALTEMPVEPPQQTSVFLIFTNAS